MEADLEKKELLRPQNVCFPMKPSLFLPREMLVFLIVTIAPVISYAQTSFTTVEQGVAFEVTAELIDVPGGWGVEVQVRARSIDGDRHGFSATPLSFHGRRGDEVGCRCVWAEPRARLVYPWPITIWSDRDALFSRSYPRHWRQPPITREHWVDITVRISAFESLMHPDDGDTTDLALVRLDIDDLNRAKLRVLPAPKNYDSAPEPRR